MLIYIYLFIIIAIFSLLEILTSKRSSQPVFWSLVAILIIFVGFRGENVGFDYGSYLSIFNDIGNDNLNVPVEPAYLLLNKILYPLGYFPLLLFVMASIAITTKCTFISKYSSYPISSLLVYFSIAMLINDMGQIRFGMAVSFIMLSYGSMIRGNKAHMWISFILGLLFHYSSLLVLPVYFIYSYRLTSKTVFILLLFGLCFYVVSINDILIKISGFMPSHIAGKIQFYTFYSDTYGKSLGLNISLLLRLLIFGFLFYYKKSIGAKTMGIDIITNLYFYGLIIYMVFNSNSEFATRGSAYFKILELIILPMFIDLGKTKYDKILIWTVVICYAFYSLGKVVFDPSFGGPYLNYTNILIG
ncbi:MAG: EpsG family protein [bacterium]